MEVADLVVVGTGPLGLMNAKTYMEVNPSAQVIVLEAGGTLGGVWAKERLYPGLKTNNLRGTFQFSDFPMTEDRFGVKAGQYVPGEVMHSYLRGYAEHFDVFRHIRFSSKVETAESKGDKGWLLTVTFRDPSGGTLVETYRLLAQKLIVATGLASEPNMPDLPGSGDFGAPIFHGKDFRRQADTLKTAQNVLVMGGGKSAWDVCYEYAVSGAQVNMVIRSSGNGPAWLSYSYVTPLKLWLERLATVRFLGWFSPCIWGDAGGYGGMQWFLHSTWIGRILVAAFWFIMGNDMSNLTGYDKHPETKKLKPWNHSFWAGGGFSIINYESDFLELVRDGKIKVHIADVTHLSAKTIHLLDGNELYADVLVCCTGWKGSPSIKFLPAGIESTLGLPYYSSEPDPLAAEADKEILGRFPRLKDQPSEKPYSYLQSKASNPSGSSSLPKVPNRAYRLYRFCVPPAHVCSAMHTIAFPGSKHSISTTGIGQVEALWVTAYLDHQIPQLNHLDQAAQEQVEWETTLHVRHCRWRHPAAGTGYGEMYPDMLFDGTKLIDLMLRDLGLRVWRKGSRWREWFVPYTSEDYVGLVAEWMEKQRSLDVNGHGKSNGTTEKKMA